jgi:hypothetical protein
VSSAAVPEFGPNDWFVEEKYQQFLTDPASVDPIWRDFFADNSSGTFAAAGERAQSGAAATKLTGSNGCAIHPIDPIHCDGTHDEPHPATDQSTPAAGTGACPRRDIGRRRRPDQRSGGCRRPAAPLGQAGHGVVALLAGQGRRQGIGRRGAVHRPPDPADDHRDTG